MMIRDRIKELRRVKAGQLRPHPKNWRTHPQAQRDALCGVLAEIGYADALLVRELPDGLLQLIDGHLRAETTPDVEVPVLVLDLDDRETAKLLALLDPLAGMAGKDRDALAGLLADVETDNRAVQALLEQMLAAPDASPAHASPDDDEEGTGQPAEVDVPELFQVVVECADESQQREIYQRMTGEGFKCRLLVM